MRTHFILKAKRKHSVLIRRKDFIFSGNIKRALFVIGLFTSIFLPAIGKAQEAGCINSDTIYVKINTVPAPVDATAANFTNCGGSYTYQWQVSTDNKYFTDYPGATSEDLNYTQPLTSTLFFLRKAKCGNVVKYTNSVALYPVYTACADFGLSMSNTSGSLAAIKAGTITTTTGSTIGEFAIEWYKDTIDGSPEFVSGSSASADPAVSVLHPFSPSGEPAEGGTWHPVIKHIYIDNIKYSRNYIPGVRHSPDLLHCLDPIVVIVNNLTCSNGGNGTYAHQITYRNALVSSTLAKRSVRFDLDSTNRYFAWQFTGYQVADEIEIIYKRSNTVDSIVLEHWKIGNDAGATDLVSSFKKVQKSSVRKIISLQSITYVPGDYLIIRIIPNANNNTDWDFYCKCFSTLDCDIPDKALRTIVDSTVSMVWNAAQCRYEVSYKRASTWANQSTSTVYRYHDFGSLSYGENGRPVISGASATDSIITLGIRKSYSSVETLSAFAGSCAALDSNCVITKVDSTVTAVFSNAADYNAFKASFNSTALNSLMTGYINDSTVLNYYKFWQVNFYVGNSCGDASTAKVYYLHYSNPPSFNDGSLTVTLSLHTLPNYYVPLSCDLTTAGAINNILSNMAFQVAQANYSVSTNIKYPNSVIGRGVIRTLLDETATPSTWRRAIRVTKVDNNICDMATKGWIGNRITSGDEWTLDLLYDRVTITEPTNPTRNFKLERLVNIDGVLQTITIYEIAEGALP